MGSLAEPHIHLIRSCRDILIYAYLFIVVNLCKHLLKVCKRVFRRACCAVLIRRDEGLESVFYLLRISRIDTLDEIVYNFFIYTSRCVYRRFFTDCTILIPTILAL